MFSIKVVLQDEVRRVQVNQDCGNEGSYLKLQESLRNIFPALKNSQFLLTWQDEEGDSISASSDGELFEALQILGGGESIPRFTVKIIEGTSSESRDAAVTHHGVTCDECGVSPIRGVRFQCTVRPDFDLCSTCEARQAQPYPMTKITESVHNNGCPRFGGRWGGPGGRGGCHGRGGGRGFHGGRGPFGFGPFGLGSAPEGPPHGFFGPGSRHHGPHGGHHHGRKGGRGGWGGPRHCPFAGFDYPPFAEADVFAPDEASAASATEKETQARPDTRRPVMTPWGPADIVHAYLDGKDILSSLMSGLGVNGASAAPAPAAATATAAETTSSAAPVASASAAPSASVEVPPPHFRTLSEAIEQARAHGHHHGRGGRGRHGHRQRHQEAESQQGVTRDLNDEDEALQRAISESMEDSSVGSEKVEQSGPFTFVSAETLEFIPSSPLTASVSSTASDEADGVIVNAPEAVVEVVSPPVEEVHILSEQVVVPPAEPTHDELVALWGHELAVLASMGFVDTHVLVPLLQTHIGMDNKSGHMQNGSPNASHMDGMQRVVAELLGQMGVVF